MAGTWSKIEPAQCIHYARFMSKLTLAQANVVYWFLFCTVLILMVISAVQWHNMTESLKEMEKKYDEESGQPVTHHSLKALRRRNRKAHRRSANIVCTCLFLVALCAVMECFALFNIEFCDGEDLMFLYWGFWSVLTMGSLIAILGVAVQFMIVLSSVKTPAWAVALGTPVLVFAAIGWVIKHLAERIWAKIMGRIYEESDSSSDEENDGSDGESCVERWFSRAPTIISPTSDAASSRKQSENAGRGSLKRTSTC